MTRMHTRHLPRSTLLWLLVSVLVLALATPAAAPGLWDGRFAIASVDLPDVALLTMSSTGAWPAGWHDAIARPAPWSMDGPVIKASAELPASVYRLLPDPWRPRRDLTDRPAQWAASLGSTLDLRPRSPVRLIANPWQHDESWRMSVAAGTPPTPSARVPH